MPKSRLRNENAFVVFARAPLYREMLRVTQRQVRDPSGARYGYPYSERHLQCVWFDACYRPPDLRTLDGEPVRIVSPGRWNLEPGPDFLDAVLLIGREQRRVAGDIEVHVHPSDWQRHDHRSDRRYSRVVAHVTFFSGPSQRGSLPPHAVEIGLEADLKADPFFSFESVDVSAYPYAERRSPTPCCEAISKRSVDCAIVILEAAGEARLEAKAERMRHAVGQVGEQQALYAEIMCALGYKNNRAPFRSLAVRVPVDALRSESGGNADNALALLLGVSGLLPAGIPPRADDAARAYLRRLWDFWWKKKQALESVVMPPHMWSVAGVRPQNHPVRRMAAAAALFCTGKPLLDRFEAGDAPSPRQLSGRMLAALSNMPADYYWQRRLSLHGAPLKESVSLVGPERAAAILCNVLLPILVATGRLPLSCAGIQDLLPAAHDDGVVRRTAAALFGRDHNPKMYRTGLRQQGLIQICHDFCENDRSGCTACPLPAAIEEM